MRDEREGMPLHAGDPRKADINIPPTVEVEVWRMLPHYLHRAANAREHESRCVVEFGKAVEPVARVDAGRNAHDVPDPARWRVKADRNHPHH